MNNKTIIITTHYIEEAKQANRVGFMRAVRLLAEERPSTLLTKYGLVSLEDVFLRLCKTDRPRHLRKYMTQLWILLMDHKLRIQTGEQNIALAHH